MKRTFLYPPFGAGGSGAGGDGGDGGGGVGGGCGAFGETTYSNVTSSVVWQNARLSAWWNHLQLLCDVIHEATEFMGSPEGSQPAAMYLNSSAHLSEKDAQEEGRSHLVACKGGLLALGWLQGRNARTWLVAREER
jgi:hypothetical protein